jgi:hypothetical protein
MIPDAAAMGSRDVSAEDVIERRVTSAFACPVSGDSDEDAWRPSSVVCGVNYTGKGELD